MTDFAQILIGIVFLIAVFILSKKFQAYKINRACEMIVSDLKMKGAVDHSSATTLPYATTTMFKIGLRDYRPKALKYMIMADVVGATPEGTFYLKKDIINPM